MPDRISKVFQDLEPYIVRLVRQTTGGGSSGGGGTSGTFGVHGLDSSTHTGTLGDAQGPQFLKTDGTRALVGNLAVGTGYTVDGIDISAHAADPDAHHARATAGDGIDVTGQAVAVDVTDIIDTAYGLTEDSNNLRVNLYGVSGMNFIGGALRLDLRTDSGLSLDADGIALGTPSSLSVSSSNAVSGAGHTHTITASSDVGTTPAAALLKSTAAGGLIVATLGVKGDVDITNAGDLYVAGSVGGASGVLITQGDRVGFGRLADPQFTVDVNGPLRADILVGKHAIQLEGVLLLAHYDGAEPYASNFKGELNGHMGQVATTSGGVSVRPGRFYKALQMAGAATNYCTNPSFGVDTAGWNNTGGGTWSRVTTDAAVGVACLKGVVSGGGQAMYMDIARPVGDTFVVSAYVRRETPTGNAGFYVCDSSFGNIVTSPDVAEADGWRRVSATYTVQADGVLRVVLRGAAGTHYFDGIQVEYTRLTPYCDGSLGTGHGWTGTAHASTSYRTDASLSYGTAGNIRAERGTIMAWVWVDANTANNGCGILEAGSAWGYLSFYMSNGLTPVLYAGNASGTANASGPSAGGVGQWVHVACSWSIYTDTMTVYTNGVKGTPATLSNTPLLAATMSVGDMPLIAGEYHLNGLIDDLVILDRVMTDNEIMAVYESDAPVFAESSVFSFRATPDGLVWADENGLWMRDIDGNAVLGAYGGSAATNSWGGKTLGRGDILFGRYGSSDGGWLYFDRDGVSSKPFISLGYADKTVFALDSGGATLDGILDISTAGGIYQGSGTFASPTTGLKLWNDGGTGRIAGYNAGTVQWYANTDGKLYAGGGDVILDANGITIDPTATVTPQPWNKIKWHDGTYTYGDVYVDNVSGGPSSILYLDSIRTFDGYSRTEMRAQDDSGDWVSAYLDGQTSTFVVVGDLSVTGSLTGAWSNVSFGSGWENVDASRTAQYKKFGDVVWLRGVAKRTSGSGTSICTLPAGYRPARAPTYGVLSAGAIMRLDVTTGGVVTYVSGGDPTNYVCLDGVSFSTL